MTKDNYHLPAVLDIFGFDPEEEFQMVKQNAGMSYFMDLFIEIGKYQGMDPGFWNRGART